MKGQYDRAGAIRLLTDMRDTLSERGESRYPKRDDFLPEQVAAIKAFLGPWPRALEAAGIKPPRDPERREKRMEKRILQRRRATQCKIEKQKKERDFRASCALSEIQKGEK